METNSLPQITIPKPCHEDWSKMTPDQRGAFCSVCSKSVWDFTSKTPDEIKNILEQESGKNMCGRFRKDQLAQPVEVKVPFYLLKDSRLPWLTRFTLATFVIFGTTLFTFATMQGQIVKGKVMLSDDLPKPPPKETIKLTPAATIRGEIAVNTVDTGIADPLSDIEVVGEFIEDIPDDLPQVPVTDSVKPGAPGTIKCDNPKVIEPKDLFIVGQMRMPVGEETTLPQLSPEKSYPVPLPIEPEEIFEGYVGNISVVPQEERPKRKNRKQNNELRDQRNTADPSGLENIPQPETPMEQHAIEPPREPELVELPPLPFDGSNNLPDAGTLSIAPNPTTGMLNLKYSIPAKAKVTIEVYDARGSRLQQLITGERHDEGDYARTFDVSALPAGAYLCVMKTGEVQETVRFVKAE